MQASVTINQLSPISTTWLANVRHSCGSNLDALAISSHPAPRAGAIAALENSLLVDLGDDIAITREQRLGGAHLGTERQLALTEAVRAVFCKFLGAAGRFGPTASGAIGAFVHLAARAEIADLRILRRAERAGIEAIAAADTQILGMQHDAVFRRIDAGHRTDRRAGRVGTVHAGHRDRALAGLAVIDGDDAA